MPPNSDPRDDSSQPRPIIIHAKESLLGKLAMGLFCSTVVTILMNFLFLKKAVLFTFAGILAFCGWKTEPPQEIKDKASSFFERAEDAARSRLSGGNTSRYTPESGRHDTETHAVSGRCPGCGTALTIGSSTPITDDDHATCYRCNREFVIQELEKN
jgi:hypothetical protein